MQGCSFGNLRGWSPMRSVFSALPTRDLCVLLVGDAAGAATARLANPHLRPGVAPYLLRDAPTTVRGSWRRSTTMLILGEWLEGKMDEAAQAFASGRPAALAMVLGELRGALVARDGNTPEIFTAIDRLRAQSKG